MQVIESRGIAESKREEIVRRVEDINVFATLLDHLSERPVRAKPVLRIIEGGRND